LRTLIALAWLTAAVQVINGLLIARLNAVGRQIFAAILSLPPGLASIAILIAVPGEGIWIAAAGVLFGTIGVTAIALAVQRESFLWRWPALRSLRDLRVSRSAWLSVVALTCFSSYAVIDTFWAPRAGQGVLSGLGYAQRILIGAGNLVIIGPSAIAVPFLARIAASGDKRAFRWATLKIVLGVALCGGGIAILLSNRSDLIVSVLFQRGAFAPSAVRLVASALKHLAPGMAAMLIGVILMRALFCLPGSYVWSAVIGLGWSALYFSLSGVFLARQATGLADAYSLAWVITILAASIILWKRSAAIGEAGAARTGEGASTSLA
jgi:putative peptidoglycan lipid II flippase